MKKVLVYFLLFLLVFRLSQGYFSSSQAGFQKGDEAVIRACLEEQPRLRGNTQSFVLGEVRVNTPHPDQFNFGDCLEVRGKLDSYEKYGKEFFYLEEPEISSWQPGAGKRGLESLKSFGFWVQNEVKRIYDRYLPEPVSSLLSGIVLGAKSKLPGDFYQKLQKTGTLHIVVASGYNLTVISQIPVDFLAWFIGRKAALLFGGGLVWLYVLIAGGQPPVVRAGIIITLVYLSQFLGKKFSVWRAFWLTIWLMLIISPSLLTSISFQLSVAAMFGMLYFEDKWDRLSEIRWVGSSLAESLSAQIMVLPIIGYHFGTVSWASPLINMFILPLIPLFMFLGLFSLGGIIAPILGIPFLFLAYPLGWLMVETINAFGKLPFLEFSFSFPWWLVLVYYLLVLGWTKKELLFKRPNKGKEKWEKRE